MITIYDVLRRPHLSEKAVFQKEQFNAVVFQVHPSANKIQIAQAVEKFFEVKVRAVRTANFNGKIKRFGKKTGRRQDWKKAVVYLKEGESLDFA